MAIVLGANRYGKAETRLFRIDRDSERHTVRDLNVSSSLTGDFRAAHLEGDQTNVLPTDTQKNTVFAFAKSVGVGEIEEFGLALARHFVDDVEPVTGSDVRIEEYVWSGSPWTPRATTMRSRRPVRRCAPPRSWLTQPAAMWSADSRTW